MAKVDDFIGNWTYRSFVNNTEIAAEADDLLRARCGLKLEVDDVSSGSDAGGSKISGRLSFGQFYLIISGTVEPGDPSVIRFRGTGAEGTGTAGWIYDYVGYLAPTWSDGERQLPTLVGTVIRTVEHPTMDGGMSPAGYTMSFIAVLSDQPS